MKLINSKYYLFLIILLSLGFSTPILSIAQDKEIRKELRIGNKFYKKDSLAAAEVAYRKALALNPEDSIAMYNLANVLLKTKRSDEAAQLYQKLQEKMQRGTDAWADLKHNSGNLFMANKKYAEAIEQYKESLRTRPNDDETRYNLVLAQKLLEKQQQNGGGKDNKQDQNKDDQKDKDKKDQDKDKDKQQQQDKDKKDQQQPQDDDKDKKNKAQQQPSNAPEKMSKDNAEKILKAFLEDEKKTQEKVNKAKAKQDSPRPSKKNW